MEPALSPCRLLSGSMNSSMAPRACGDRPNLWMCGVPRGRANVWEGWQQMFWTCGHYPLTPWTYVWLNPPYLEERSQIRCGILGWFAACSVRAVCWMNSGWIELRTIHQMEFSTEMWGPCAPNDFWIFDPLDPQSFVRSMACHFHTAFCHACEACVRVFCRHYLNVGDILTESGHILADLWKNWC